MMPDVELGLDLVGGNPNLTFIFFIALVLLGVLGLRFSVYAHLNDRAVDMAGQTTLWQTLTLAGATAVLFALLGVLDIVSTIETPYRRGVLLAHVLSLAFVLQVLCRDSIPTGTGTGGWAGPGRIFWTASAAVVAGVTAGTAWNAEHTVIAALEGFGALAFLLVGVAVGRRGTAASRVQGTVVDTLLRHLLPVLVFASLVPIAQLAVVAGLDRVVALHIQVVFVIMTATALMTATIKLRQNLAGL
jgi:hypothetical protein